MTEHTEDELKQLKDELKKAEKERDTYREAFRLMLRWADRNSKWGKGSSYFGKTRISLPLRLQAQLRKLDLITEGRTNDHNPISWKELIGDDKYKEGFLIVCRWIDRNSKYEKGISFIDGEQVSVPQRLEKRLRAKKCLTMTRNHGR